MNCFKNDGIVCLGRRSGAYLWWSIWAGLSVGSQYAGRLEQSDYVRVNDGTQSSTGLFLWLIVLSCCHRSEKWSLVFSFNFLPNGRFVMIPSAAASISCFCFHIHTIFVMLRSICRHVHPPVALPNVFSFFLVTPSESCCKMCPIHPSLLALCAPLKILPFSCISRFL